MALDCLTDYIGLAICDGDMVYEAPPSGFYITQMPGITMEAMDKIATEDQVTYLGVWNDIQKNAIAQFGIDVMMKMNACYNLNKECDYHLLICENMDVLVQAFKYLLAETIMVFRLSTNRINRYTTVDRDQAIELRGYYREEYEKNLGIGVQLMDTSGCELCCGGNPEVVTWLP